VNGWPDSTGAAIDSYVQQLRLRHPRASRLYRSELLRFQRFIEIRGVLDEATVTAWLRERDASWPRHLVVDRANKVNRFLDHLVATGLLADQPFALLRTRFRQRALAPIIHALLSPDPAVALEELSGTARFGSFLGDLLREHIEVRRALGYRFVTQAASFAALDRFLQGRPDLAGQSLGTIIQAWSEKAMTIEQQWAAQCLARDLSKAWSRIDPDVPRWTPDRSLRRQVLAARRRPFIYTPDQLAAVFEAARGMISPRAPLRPATAYAMLALTYCAGLRIGELVRLELRDASIEHGTIRIRDSKFHKTRLLPLEPSTVAVLRDYLAERRCAGAPLNDVAPLFWRQTRSGGGRYARLTASNLLVGVLRRAGVKPASGRRGPRIHDLRHSFVHYRMLSWYQAGVDPQSQLPYLATFLGHRDINSTLCYITATPELLGIAAERFRSQIQSATLGALEVRP
jgi:integrase